jgi:chromosomal replication initiator protein
MHAIGNDFAKNSPNKMVIFVSSDDFVREIYSALTAKNNEIETIKNKYQSCDLLLIDDVQFFAKKEKINEIFFNILNYKISHNQFVVMTSDKHPTLLNDFENRMISRFNSGLCVKIHKHDLGSLKNILLQKIKNNDDGYVFTQDSIDYITRRCQNDVRKLEGLLNTILFFITNNLPPKSIVTLQNIKNILGDEEKELKKMYGTDPEFVVDYICDLYHTEVDEIKSKKKTKHLSMVRHVCMYVLKEKYGLSLSSIGSCLGGRDHTTVIEGVKKIKYLIQKDAELNSFLNNIVKKI